MEIKDRVLIVEDDKNIRKFIQTILEANDYDVIATETGKEAYSLITSRCPDVVILDLGLPDMDGMKILKEVRAWSNMPIIVVSARDHEKDKVEALDMGADDYITKPFELEELYARISVQLRKTSQQAPSKCEKYKDLVLSKQKHTVMVKGYDLNLTRQEFKILELLLSKPDKVFSKQEIYDYAWDDYYIGEDKTVNVHISHIRSKIKQYTDDEYIETVWGIGFKLAE